MIRIIGLWGCFLLLTINLGAYSAFDFDLYTTVNLSGNPAYANMAQLDDDVMMEVVCPPTQGGLVSAYDHDGTPLWTFQTGWYGNIDVADVNGDGYSEVGVISADRHFYYLDHQGNQLWVYSIRRLGHGRPWFCQLDTDADIEIICKEWDSNANWASTCYIYALDPEGQKLLWEYPLPDEGVLVVKDLDGDSMDEVIVVSRPPGGTPHTTLLDNYGTVIWDIVQSNTSGYIDAYDYNSDNYLDPVIDNEGPTVLDYQNGQQLAHTSAYGSFKGLGVFQGSSVTKLFTSDLDETLSLLWSSPTPGNCNIFDADDNGVNEILVAPGTGDRFWFLDENGDVLFEEPLPSGNTGQPRLPVNMGDFSGDGVLDLVIGDGTSHLYYYEQQTEEPSSFFEDDFEDGNIDGWSVVPTPWDDHYGDANISTKYAHNGNYSMELSHSGAVQRNGFTAREGIYEAWFYVDSGIGDGNLFFQYQDRKHYYRLYMCPNGTDNPEFHLILHDGENVDELASIIPPPFDQDEWFKVTVYRHLNGDIQVYINDELQMSLNDTTLTAPGKFLLGCWDRAYVDDVSFSPFIVESGTITLAESGPPTWIYTLTHENGEISSWTYNGNAITDAEVTGTAADNDWTVTSLSSNSVRFSTTTPLTSGSVTGFQITGSAGGVGQWICGSNSGSIEGSLPVVMSSFTASTVADGVQLKWRTESEMNNLGFNVYRSEQKDGNFTQINSRLISGQGTSAISHDYSFTDDTAKLGQNYYYYIEDVDYSGKVNKSHILKITVREKKKIELLPKETVLLQNYPNPFNPETWIPFHLSKTANVVISVFDIHGQLVRKIELGEKPAGVYVSKDQAVYWDGRNEAGEEVSSGTYFYHLQAGDYSPTKSMLILK